MEFKIYFDLSVKVPQIVAIVRTYEFDALNFIEFNHFPAIKISCCFECN